MKFFLYLATSLILLISANSAVTAQTTSDSQSTGSVATNQDGDVLYLTTNVVNNSSEVKSENTSNDQSVRQNNPSTSSIVVREGYVDNLGTYLSAILRMVLVVAVLLVFFQFIQAGLQWITSGGDKGKTEDSRNRILHAIIGIIVLASSVALMNLITYTLGSSSVDTILLALEPLNQY